MSRLCSGVVASSRTGADADPDADEPSSPEPPRPGRRAHGQHPHPRGDDLGRAPGVRPVARRARRRRRRGRRGARSRASRRRRAAPGVATTSGPSDVEQARADHVALAHRLAAAHRERDDPSGHDVDRRRRRRRRRRRPVARPRRGRRRSAVRPGHEVVRRGRDRRGLGRGRVAGRSPATTRRPPRGRPRGRAGADASGAATPAGDPAPEDGVRRARTRVATGRGSGGGADAPAHARRARRRTGARVHSGAERSGGGAGRAGEPEAGARAGRRRTRSPRTTSPRRSRTAGAELERARTSTSRTSRTPSRSRTTRDAGTVDDEPGAAVGAVEARALEDDADGVVELAQLAAARGALGQGVVGERLHDLQRLAAGGARVLVGGHGVLLARVGSRWHSGWWSANDAKPGRRGQCRVGRSGGVWRNEPHRGGRVPGPGGADGRLVRSGSPTPARRACSRRTSCAPVRLAAIRRAVEDGRERFAVASLRTCAESWCRDGAHRHAISVPAAAPTRRCAARAGLDARPWQSTSCAAFASSP